MPRRVSQLFADCQPRVGIVGIGAPIHLPSLPDPGLPAWAGLDRADAHQGHETPPQIFLLGHDTFLRHFSLMEVEGAQGGFQPRRGDEHGPYRQEFYERAMRDRDQTEIRTNERASEDTNRSHRCDRCAC
jgi:hypothetical protein